MNTIDLTVLILASHTKVKEILLIEIENLLKLEPHQIGKVFFATLLVRVPPLQKHHSSFTNISQPMLLQDLK